VISISVDEGLAARPEIVKFIKKAKPTFTVLHDPTLVAQRAFGVEGIPMNVALDRTGKIIALAGGDEEELKRAMAALARSAPSHRVSAR
jgi:hypothetical protein